MNEWEKLNPHYKHYKISRIQDICERLPSLHNLSDTFNKLNELNLILAQILPEHLVKFCRIGSFDYDRNCPILFVTDQQAYHILRNFSEHIIQSFYNKGFHFDSIITKVANQNTIAGTSVPRASSASSTITPRQSTNIKQQNQPNNTTNRTNDTMNNYANKNEADDNTLHRAALVKLAVALGKPELILDESTQMSLKI
jgi:hypothetical protein